MKHYTLAASWDVLWGQCCDLWKATQQNRASPVTRYRINIWTRNRIYGPFCQFQKRALSAEVVVQKEAVIRDHFIALLMPYEIKFHQKIEERVMWSYCGPLNLKFGPYSVQLGLKLGNLGYWV